MYRLEVLNLVSLVLKSGFLTLVPADLGGVGGNLLRDSRFLCPRTKTQTARPGLQIVASKLRALAEEEDTSREEAQACSGSGGSGGHKGAFKGRAQPEFSTGFSTIPLCLVLHTTSWSICLSILNLHIEVCILVLREPKAILGH